MKKIYTYYKERLIEISGKNKSLYTKKINSKNGLDLGLLAYYNKNFSDKLNSVIWDNNDDPLTVISPKLTGSIISSMKSEQTEKCNEEIAVTSDFKTNNLLSKEITGIKYLKNEIEEIEKDTGRHELFIAYPFVLGGTKNLIYKAPLMLIPADIDVENETKVSINIRREEPVRLNKSFILAYAEANKLNIEELVTEFENLYDSGITNIKKLLSYMLKFGFKMNNDSSNPFIPFNSDNEPRFNEKACIYNYAVLGRYSLTSSIYNDYTELEKNKISSPALDELLNKNIKIKKKNNQNNDLYYISNLDFAQRNVIYKVANEGNAVIYGPPGTGKSEVIVNLIADALSKQKKVLIVSQKKTALDVVYNRLRELNKKAILLSDPIKERAYIYNRILLRHNEVSEGVVEDYSAKKELVTLRIKEEINKLEKINNTLHFKSKFGLSLSEMYYYSFVPDKVSGDYDIYVKLINNQKIMEFDYKDISDVTNKLLGDKRYELYYKFIEIKKKNPYINEIRENLPLDTLAQARSLIKKLSLIRVNIFDEPSSPYVRKILSCYEFSSSKKDEENFIRFLAQYENPKESKKISASKYFWPLYPFAKNKMDKKVKETRLKYYESKNSLEKYTKDYLFLKDVLTNEGYATAIEELMTGNETVFDDLKEALNKYVKVSDMKYSLESYTENEKIVLDFAYKNSDSYQGFQNILTKITPIRIYSEVLAFEDKMKASLSMSVEYEGIKNRIIDLMNEEEKINMKIALQSFDAEYKKSINNSTQYKNYLYQITKKQNYLPLRKLTEEYGDNIFKLFPCWLLSPENVSSILPLKEGLFDYVLFDEASQIFIENTIPSIIRGKNIVVAGDTKQLRPTTSFMRRYMGSSNEEDFDESTQAALEVESLLDLAISRYQSCYLSYHYRSACHELIDFSNRAFYSGQLVVAPNFKNYWKSRAIERIKVDGKWIDRSNKVEAEETVKLLSSLFSKKKSNESIGIITFGAEQQKEILDCIDEEAIVNEQFRNRLTIEKNRKQNGEDVSLFVKNIENVQGDERDIIIFSIGYAPNQNGKVNAHFGSLSYDGGENRLNVAITRAKQKIYLITSIEPEQLKIEESRNNGPKLFKKYLEYVRSVSNKTEEETENILNGIYTLPRINKVRSISPIEEQIADRLNKLNYKVKTNINDGKNKISIGVFDLKTKKTLLGIQVDSVVAKLSDSILERDVFAVRFLEEKGWKILRIWARDWWHNPDGVIENIVKQIEKESA